ncbi:sugar phosphate isomerase/epimerase [Caulobacter sp. 602-1]|nr:sugar phosphate isomerase/epimerase [Caulobacter sp. 602-1]
MNTPTRTCPPSLESRRKSMDRRTFGKLLGAGAMGVASLAEAAWPAQPWGVQLFTVLEPLERDFDGALREVAAIGYKEVETIGSFGRDPAAVRATFEKYGLRSPSQHLAPPSLYAAFSAWARRETTTEGVRAAYSAAFTPQTVMPLVEQAVVSAKALGQTYVIWPILLEAHLADRARLDTFIALFNQAGALCRREGLVFAFHNHDREFRRFGDDVILDLILKGTDPALVKFELDFYWASKAGVDPVAYFTRYADRFRACHVKDMKPDRDFAAVGDGVLPIAALISAARRSGVRHFYVEYDRSNDPLAEIRKSYGYLQRLRI